MGSKDNPEADTKAHESKEGTTTAVDPADTAEEDTRWGITSLSNTTGWVVTWAVEWVAWVGATTRR